MEKRNIACSYPPMSQRRSKRSNSNGTTSNSNSNPPQQLSSVPPPPPPPPAGASSSQPPLSQQGGAVDPTQHLNDLVASFNNNKSCSWVGTMSFDVASARLNYTRVIIGESRMAVNVGDVVMYISTAGAGDASVRFGRVKGLFHNPRSEKSTERTAAIAESTQLGSTAQALDAAGVDNNSSSSSSSSVLSRLILNLDQRAAGAVLRKTLLEVPIQNIIGKVELRDASELSSGCLACFVRHTPSIQISTCIDWTRLPVGSSQAEPAAAAMGKNSLTQNIAAAGDAAGPPVLLTCNKLLDAVNAFNEYARNAASAGGGGGGGGKPLLLSGKKLEALHGEVDCRLTSLVGRSLAQSQQQSCQACRSSLSRNASAASSPTTATAAFSVANIVVPLLKRLLLEVPADSVEHDEFDLTQTQPSSSQQNTNNAVPQRRDREDEQLEEHQLQLQQNAISRKKDVYASCTTKRIISNNSSSLVQCPGVDLRFLVVQDKSKFSQ